MDSQGSQTVSLQPSSPRPPWSPSQTPRLPCPLLPDPPFQPRPLHSSLVPALQPSSESFSSPNRTNQSLPPSFSKLRHPRQHFWPGLLHWWAWLRPYDPPLSVAEHFACRVDLGGFGFSVGCGCAGRVGSGCGVGLVGCRCVCESGCDFGGGESDCGCVWPCDRAFGFCCGAWTSTLSRSQTSSASSCDPRCHPSHPTSTSSWPSSSSC
mmetsp:Transcript_1749/g.4066  ORF Transcript_1749/g.4066 Transcript_1749/m.4066 type:complete len:209 (+) Transcript_1749:1059-1685(+)